MTKLLLAERVVFTCQNSGACCRNDWLIGVDDASHERLRNVNWPAVDPALGPGEKFARLADPLPGGERVTFARTASGGCVFLAADERCSIHRHLGAAAKPQVCREFPYSFVQTPDGVAVGVSFACTAVRAHQGRTLAEQQDEISGVLAGSTRVRTLPDPIVLYSSVDITWEQYRPLETALLDLLDHDECTLPVALLSGSALISLCVGLTQMEARARREGRPSTETLVGGLEQLRADRFRRILAIAARARYPRRPSLTPLAPLYTWLEFSRRKLSRVGLVAALYRAARRSLGGERHRRPRRRPPRRAALRSPRPLRRRLLFESRPHRHGRPPLPAALLRPRRRPRARRQPLTVRRAPTPVSGCRDPCLLSIGSAWRVDGATATVRIDHHPRGFGSRNGRPCTRNARDLLSSLSGIAVQT